MVKIKCPYSEPYSQCNAVCSLADKTTCDVLPQKRVNCGHAGITHKACELRGCCWQTNVRDAPWCYFDAVTTQTHTTTELPEPNCDVGDPQNRENCGTPEIDEDGCHEKGCCWDSKVSGVPWCFYGVRTTTPVMTTERPEPNCDIGDPQNRENCGTAGMDKKSCRAKGCCWDSKVSGVAWCFHGVRTTTNPISYQSRHIDDDSESKCDVGSPSKRVNCGYSGIDPVTCRQRGCCWDNSIHGVAWCFYGKDVKLDLNCNVGPPSKRENCGYIGIPEYTCRQRNCCWDNSIPGVVWCFFGVSVTTPPPIAHCNVPTKSRKRCGHRHIERYQCVNKGCCWEPSTTHRVPSCYFAGEKPSPSGCNPHLPNRLTCGYIGINAQQCAERSCCWDDTVPGRPKCYLPNTGQPSTTSTTTSYIVIRLRFRRRKSKLSYSCEPSVILSSSS